MNTTELEKGTVGNKALHYLLSDIIFLNVKGL